MAKKATEDKSKSSTPAAMVEAVSGAELTDNRKLAVVVQAFKVESQKNLTSFIHKKADIVVDGISLIPCQKISSDSSRSILLEFQIAPFNIRALLVLDFLLLQTAIDLLYGGDIHPSEKLPQSLGKFGIRIAKKLSALFLSALQLVFQEESGIMLNLEEATHRISLFFNQPDSLNVYDISLKINIASLQIPMHLILPETLFTEAGQASTNSQEPGAHGQETQLDLSYGEPIFDEEGKRKLMQANIELSASLVAAIIKLKELVNLKPGDMIPIDDPTKVYVSVNNKKVFQANAGQSQARRVVKIVDKL